MAGSKISFVTLGCHKRVCMTRKAPSNFGHPTQVVINPMQISAETMAGGNEAVRSFCALAQLGAIVWLETRGLIAPAKL